MTAYGSHERLKPTPRGHSPFLKAVIRGRKTLRLAGCRIQRKI